MIARCTSCGAPIEWARTKVNGRPIPLDLERIPRPLDANIKVERDKAGGLVASVVPAGMGSQLSHFATCPNAAKHRKGGNTR